MKKLRLIAALILTAASAAVTAAAAVSAAEAAEIQAAAASASEPEAARPITSLYGLEAGAASINCNYLSPLPYNGPAVAWYGAWGKEMRQAPGKLVMAFRAGVEYSKAKSPARNASMLALTARFGWGPSWRHRLPDGWEITAGAALDIYGGILWLPVNGNNPAQALAYAGLDITAGVSWKTRFGRLPVTFADRAWLPSAGAFFMPGFGESYYEIYLGNRRGLAHFGWWGNAFGIDNHLTMTLHFRNRRSLVIGYRLDVRSFRANNLTDQYVRNALSVALQIN